jgi:hypothetical protein
MSNNATVEQIAKQGLEFFNTLRVQQQQVFGENQAALNAITKAWAPVLTSGQVPYGYSPGLDSLLQANAIDVGTQAETNAANAEALREKQAAGGANVMPTGASDAINAQILAAGQQKIGENLQQEKIAGYKQGLANLEGATAAESDIAKETNPTGYAEATTGAGSMAEKAGSDMFAENQATSGMSTFKGIAGGIASLGGAAKDFAGAFHKGGVVPGKKGEEKTATLLAGEYVIPAPKTRKRKTMLDKVLANA